LASVDHLIEDEKPIIITIAGVVTDSKTGEPMASVPVIVQRLPDGADIGEVTTDDEGKYELALRPGARFGFGASKDGYLGQNENLDLNEVEESKTITVDLKLVPVAVGQPLVLKNIFFEFNKDVLTTSSYPELERVLGYMKEGRIGKIEVAGHTDSTGPAAYNQGFSERRAKAVYNYFLQNGLTADQMVSKGYGMDQPVATNDTKEGRQQNRRVEFRVLEAN